MPQNPDFNCRDILTRIRDADDSQRDLAERACRMAVAAQDGNSRLPQSPAVAEILLQLGVDAETVIAALLSDPRLRQSEQRKAIAGEFGPTIAEMVESVDRLNTFREYSSATADRPEQTERLRRLLLSMTRDLRVMLIKLAYRLERLRILPADDFETRKFVARETLDLYTPLANRLGVGQLKWELEDLAFRYLEPQTYRRVAQLLEDKRTEREAYIEQVIFDLRQAMARAGIRCEISGRPKHIYSIWNKMRRKHLDFDQLFDLRAVRIYVQDTRDCYAVLGEVHNLWTPVKGEFDDYIAHPKPNGYQSLHTAVYGPEGKTVEIQIRTYAMHEAAEYGVASHWRYKEGGGADAQVERAIAGLRRLLEDPAALPSEFDADLDLDRVYVFTPEGDVLELERGATPLDFAYAVHSGLGHACRGAKVNGRIRPLTYTLKTGDRVEILSVKGGEPKRNWLNPHLGYVHTSRARTKIRHWFNQADRARNTTEGRALLERELRRLDIGRRHLPEFVRLLHCDSQEQLWEGLGKGSITSEQLAAAAQRILHPEQHRQPARHETRERPNHQAPTQGDVHVGGVGNLLTHMAKCCNPLPGDPIVGFVTRGKGVTVHRQDCPNVLNMDGEDQARLISVEWTDQREETYPARVVISAFDRKGLLNDITGLLSGEKVNLVEVNTRTDRDDQSVAMTLTLEIRDLTQLARVMDRIGQLPNVEDVYRQS